MNIISPKAKIGHNVQFGFNVIIGDNVVIHDFVEIGNNTIIDNSVIGSGTIIESNCIIGYSKVSGWISREPEHQEINLENLIIGNNCLIREGSTLYMGSKLGNSVKINHKALIRANSIIGDYTSIGSMTELDGNLSIGEHCSIHSQNHICSNTTIQDYVFIAPLSVTAEGDPMTFYRPQLYQFKGPEIGPFIESGCQIGVNVILYPRIRLGHECIVGSSAVVTKSFEPLSVLSGCPAKRVSEVKDFFRLPLEIRKKIGIEK
jgi:UDP-2-acetamido-3-amino-2,3-dideoxy-glucuronate N-acetyltransferase